MLMGWRMEEMKESNTLSDKEIVYFYKLLYRYEKIICKNPKGFKYNKIKKFVKEHSINLDYTNPVKEHEEKNKIIFTQHISVCACFIRHIRNAFAHGSIKKEKNFYTIIDYDKKYKKQTMYGKINKELLPKLIKEMESTRT